jgi:hypothetical protein
MDGCASSVAHGEYTDVSDVVPCTARWVGLVGAWYLANWVVELGRRRGDWLVQRGWGLATGVAVGCGAWHGSCFRVLPTGWHFVSMPRLDGNFSYNNRLAQSW